jgi:hypothetical protein
MKVAKERVLDDRVMLMAIQIESALSLVLCNYDELQAVGFAVNNTNRIFCTLLRLQRGFKGSVVVEVYWLADGVC